MSATTRKITVGLARRLAAATYDLLLLLALWMLVTALFLPFNDGDAPAAGSPLFQLHRFVLLATAAAFYCGFWKFGGQTLGMRAWRFRVLRDDGEALKWRDCGVRLLASIAAVLPLGAGIWWALFDSRNRGWHDALSQTHLERVS